MVEEMNIEEGLLRGVEWRIKLGVLPANTRSISQLRRAAADGRRKYAELRRRLLVDPHIMEENHAGADLSMDNPLSQNPESVWGRFFRNAELERTIDNDLSRLYPEHGSYFQTTSCQAILRRILLLRALRYPEHSYRQGMHELLAPLLYVLHVDIMHLSHVKHLYGDLFDDRFEDLSFQEINRSLSKNFEERKNISIFGKTVMKVEDEDKSVDSISSVDSSCTESSLGKLGSSDNLDTDFMSIILSSDAYGVEGELGALLSTRFLEHDAYCMYDALLSGAGGAVAMADYFTNTPAAGSIAGLPPVIEASADIYKLLAIADISLYCHLVDLGVEPQYFALRWLRVLFGREFVLENLLHVWDAIFEASNTPLSSYGDVHGSSIPYSPRSAFISAVAVSLLLHLRSSLLSTTNATTCLQKLLNFPKDAEVKKLIHKAKLLQALALDTNDSSPPSIGKMGQNFENGGITKLVRSTSASPSCQAPKLSHKAAILHQQKSSSCAPDKLTVAVPESYWEQKWRSSMLQRNVPEDSFGQESECLGKALPGQVDFKNSADASCQEHIVSNSVDSSESQEIGNENSSIPSIADPGFSNVIGAKHESGTSSVRSARRKLLDDKFERNDTNTTDKNVSSGNNFDQHNERRLVDNIDDRGTDILKCNDSLKDFNSDTPSVQRSESQSKFCFDKEKNQETNALASTLDVRLTTELEVDKNSMHAKDKMNNASMAAKEESSEVSISGGGHIQTSLQRPGEVSMKCSSKEPSGKIITSGSSQIEGNSGVTRKQNPATAAHSGKIHWIWNLFRNTGVEKGSNGLFKTKGKETIAPDCKKVFPEKSSTSPENKNDKGNSHYTCENKTKRDQPSQICEDGRDQAIICEYHGDQASHICEDIRDHHSHNFEDDRPEPLQISEDSRDQPLHISEDSVQPSHVCENDRENLFSDHEINGDELSCSSDASSANAANCSSSPPLVKSEATLLSKSKDPSDNLRILGQSMLENIQVIESTFLQSCVTKNKDEMHVASTERLEHSSMNVLAGKGQAAALVALTELRKISNVLSQM